MKTGLNMNVLHVRFQPTVKNYSMFAKGTTAARS
jgi:hypothetical protein